MRQRELLHRREEVLKTDVVAKDQIKTITEDLLRQLNEAYAAQNKRPLEDDQDSQISGHSSETSSVAEEREIQQKLHQILRILNAQKQVEQIQQEELEEQKQNLTQFNETLYHSVYEDNENAGADGEDLQVFVIQDWQQDQDHEDPEYEKFFEDARNYHSETDEEEKSAVALPASRGLTV